MTIKLILFSIIIKKINKNKDQKKSLNSFFAVLLKDLFLNHS